MPRSTKVILGKMYERLYALFGPQHWWPGETQCEIIIGAILTQNTNWTNVEKAIHNLKEKKLLNQRSLKEVPLERLASLIRPAGYFNVKAKRIKNFIHFLFEKYEGKIGLMGKTDAVTLRRELLGVDGIGPETADSILLYAFHKSIFVIDAYTKRILYRHNLIQAKTGYDEIQNIFLDALKRDERLFNEYHALIVHLGKNFCRTRPRCEECPLKDISYSLTHRCRMCYRTLMAGERGKSVGDVCQICRRS